MAGEALRNRVYTNLKKRRQRLLDGEINRIPSPFTRFSDDFIGIEQDCFYAVTSFTKGGKSQFASYAFIYEPLMYCYSHRDTIDMKILYFPLEETPERVMQRFISWFLYDSSNGAVRVSPKDLRSTTSPLGKEVLNMIAAPAFQDILKFFEERVLFSTDSCNPTGIFKYCQKYAEEHGNVFKKKVQYKDELGEIKEREVFDHYEQDNPNEYRLIIVDTINLIDTERGMTLKQSMDKLSEYLAKYLRNRYHFSPVVIQQQAFDQESNDALKAGRMRPSVAGLGDSKYISRDANVVLGLFSPFRFSISEYLGYDIKVFRDNIRFLEIIVNRDGEMGGICPLLFQGDVCDFKELPTPDSHELRKVYSFLNDMREKKKEKGKK